MVQHHGHDRRERFRSRVVSHPDPPGKPSGQWPRHDAFCDEIIQFCEKHVPGYDGVSFDLEGIRVFRFRAGSKIVPTKEPDFPLYNPPTTFAADARLRSLGSTQ
jgi:hypothetical protein